MTDSYTNKPWFKGRVLFGLSISCITIIGLIVTPAVLYFTMQQDIGPTYAVGIRMLTGLRQDILYKALTISGITFLFMIIGILILAMLYSHLIAGPLYHLTQFVIKVTEGHLNERVRLRDKDVIHPVAKELNELVRVYHDKFQEIKKEVNTLETLAAKMDKGEETLSKIKKKAKEIHQLTEQFHL
jgi:methyl-accepting chemotaxis protein